MERQSPGNCDDVATFASFQECLLAYDREKRAFKELLDALGTNTTALCKTIVELEKHAMASKERVRAIQTEVIANCDQVAKSQPYVGSRLGQSARAGLDRFIQRAKGIFT